MIVEATEMVAIATISVNDHPESTSFTAARWVLICGATVTDATESARKTPSEKESPMIQRQRRTIVRAVANDCWGAGTSGVITAEIATTTERAPTDTMTDGIGGTR